MEAPLLTAPLLDTRPDTRHNAGTMATRSPAKKTTASAKKTAPRKAAAPRPRKAPAAKTTRTAPAAAAVSGPRRAVFIDVENTSSEQDLVRVLDELALDLSAGNTEITAIGNWRVIGQQLGRSLAQRGAHLVHSAPRNDLKPTGAREKRRRSNKKPIIIFITFCKTSCNAATTSNSTNCSSGFLNNSTDQIYISSKFFTTDRRITIIVLNTETTFFAID